MTGTIDIPLQTEWAFLYKSNLKLVLIFLLVSQRDGSRINWTDFLKSYVYIHITSSTVSYAKEMTNT